MVSLLMDLSDKDALESALGYLRSRLGVQVPEAVAHSYFAGLMKDTGIHEKLGGRSEHPLWAYLLIAEGYLRQPSLENYYDIFKAARVIPLLRRLEMVLKLFEDSELDSHKAKVQRATTFDVLDAALFELIVAGTYRERFSNAAVTLMREGAQAKSPDILVEFAPDRKLYVECKRFDRVNQAQAALRARVSNLLNPVLQLLHRTRRGLVLRVWFECHPDNVDESSLLNAAVRLSAGEQINVSGVFRMEGSSLGRPDEDFLYPSPKYFRQRFGYVSDEWHGIIPVIEGTRSGVSFFEKTSWDAAVLWRIEHDETLWKISKLNYQLLFKGLEQLATVGRHTNLHVWFERNSAWGHRADHLQKFFDGLDRETTPFSHIIFNETHPEVTPGGYFDFREHASPIGGPLRKQDRPEVTNVFGGPEDYQGVGVWGIGATLQSLDES